MPSQQRIEFPGGSGSALAGALALPDAVARAFVLFAHCFTCGKDSLAAARISSALVTRGFGVLRFDFTGLGGSEGEFGNTDFSSNVQDLVAAADWLRAQHRAPQLLVGHSLGGAAVLAARRHIEEVRGVVTIGAPASPDHVLHQFHGDRERIEREGSAEVELAGRRFRIGRQFLEDVASIELAEIVARLRAALLLFHAPLDATVSIEQAQRLYELARHPKSFVSLDGADHLLSARADAEYVGEVISAWASRYLD
jgi:alpha/beta superfamily hydrolase